MINWQINKYELDDINALTDIQCYISKLNPNVEKFLQIIVFRDWESNLASIIKI